MSTISGFGFEYYKVVWKDRYSGLYKSFIFESLDQAKEFSRHIALCNPVVKTCYY